MKAVRALLLATLIASSLVVVTATEALACSCIVPPPDKDALKNADAVFSGTMIKADVAEPGFTPGWWTFEVDAVYKGEVGETQEVKSQTQSAACGLIFKEEKRYLVFAHEGKGGLSTSSCDNTRPIAINEDPELQVVGTDEQKEVIGPPLLEDREAPSPNLMPIAVGGASVLLVAGLAALALRKKRAGG